METIKDLRAKNARLATKNSKLRRAIAEAERLRSMVAERDALIRKGKAKIEEQQTEIVRLRKAAR